MMSQRLVEQVGEVIVRRVAFGDMAEETSQALNLLQAALLEDYPDQHADAFKEGVVLAKERLNSRA